nr:hypothetical protein [Tanacetum cinerariifolium]
SIQYAGAYYGHRDHVHRSDGAGAGPPAARSPNPPNQSAQPRAASGQRRNSRQQCHPDSYSGPAAGFQRRAGSAGAGAHPQPARKPGPRAGRPAGGRGAAAKPAYHLRAGAGGHLPHARPPGGGRAAERQRGRARGQHPGAGGGASHPAGATGHDCGRHKHRRGGNRAGAGPPAGAAAQRGAARRQPAADAYQPGIWPASRCRVFGRRGRRRAPGPAAAAARNQRAARRSAGRLPAAGVFGEKPALGGVQPAQQRPQVPPPRPPAAGAPHLHPRKQVPAAARAG